MRKFNMIDENDECAILTTPNKDTTMDELTAAKAGRQRLRAELAAIAAKRAKAGEPVAALERAASSPMSRKNSRSRSWFTRKSPIATI
jgi:hypothetical protein